MEKNVHDLLASKVYFIGYASSTSWMEENQTRATGNLPLTYEQPTQSLVGVPPDYLGEFHYRKPRAPPVALLVGQRGNNFTRVTLEFWI